MIDHPDIAAREFHIKLRALRAVFIDEAFFGEFKAHVRIIEFQKRELFYAHCILFLVPQSKTALLQQNSVDALISAEMPCTDSSFLGRVILRRSIHSPYGELNLFAVCTKGRALRNDFEWSL